MNRIPIPIPIPLVILGTLVTTALLAGCLDETNRSHAALSFENETEYRLEDVATGLDRPVQLVPHPQREGVLLVAEMGGTVRVIHGTNLSTAPLLDISDRLGEKHREQGLLGFTLHPEFPQDPRLFVTYVAPDDSVVLAVYHADDDGDGLIDPDSEEILLQVPQPHPYHNGGHIAFGPDGMLYAAFGDGGPQGDPRNHAQSLDTLLGTIIRIDVDTDDDGTGWSIPPDNPFVDRDGRDEIWLYGLRNPWRFSFDPQTGDLWVADVGFLTREEINRISAQLGGGHNLGWPRWEGNYLHREDVMIDHPVLFPVHEYPYGEPCASVTGGYVYRGTQLPDLSGSYVYADFCTGTLHALEQDERKWDDQVLLETELPVAGFGKDSHGELYVLSYDGSVSRLTGTHPIP